MNIHCARLEACCEVLSFRPDREELLIEFTRLLGAAQEGGAAVAECFSTASRIDFSDDHSWYQEWKRIAEVNRARGNDAFGRGHVLTARSNWLRATSYYQAAASPPDLSDTDRQTAIEGMRVCAALYLAHRSPRGEVVSIPWPGGDPLEGYFLPARASADTAPTLICIGEPGQRKEEYLAKVTRHASDRGIALLAVDLFGAGPDSRFEEGVGRSNPEMIVGCIMDYLVERDDVDEHRIAILSDGWGSSLVARGIAFDHRYAAAVCDGGIWDLHVRAFLKERDDPVAIGFSLGSKIAGNIKCPVLITSGERGWLQADRIRELYGELLAAERDVTLKIFTCEETAAAQGHADNPTLANEFIFDWISGRLGIRA